MHTLTHYPTVCEMHPVEGAECQNIDPQWRSCDWDHTTHYQESNVEVSRKFDKVPRSFDKIRFLLDDKGS